MTKSETFDFGAGPVPATGTLEPIELNITIEGDPFDGGSLLPGVVNLDVYGVRRRYRLESVVPIPEGTVGA